MIQAFEWIVRDVHRLRDHIEFNGQGNNSDASGFEVLKESPMLGDGKFKLEIGVSTQSSLNTNVLIGSS